MLFSSICTAAESLPVVIPRLGSGYLYGEAIKLKSAFFKCLNFEMTWLGGPVISFPSGGITIDLNNE
jgi:hypothetical protein